VLKDSALGVGGTVARARSSCSGWRPPRSDWSRLRRPRGRGPLPCDRNRCRRRGRREGRDGDARLRRGRAPRRARLRADRRVVSRRDALGLRAGGAGRLLTWPQVLPGLAALLVALATAALVVARWSRRRLGGVSGDVLGATTELARAGRRAARGGDRVDALLMRRAAAPASAARRRSPSERSRGGRWSTACSTRSSRAGSRRPIQSSLRTRRVRGSALCAGERFPPVAVDSRRAGERLRRRPAVRDGNCRRGRSAPPDGRR